MNTLKNKTILVTRPRQQAKRLCDQIRDAGGNALLHPTLEIIPTLEDDSIFALQSKMKDIDLFIFVSQNAVIHGFPLVEQGLKDSQEFAAIGNASARLLGENGIKNVIFPEEVFNSESLLELERLKNVSGQNIAIISGANPRPKLAKELVERGANVSSAFVYRRRIPSDDILGTLLDNTVDCVVCTSLACLENFFKLCGERGFALVEDKNFVVITTAMEAYANNIGIKKVWRAKNANEKALMKTITEIYEER